MFTVTVTLASRFFLFFNVSSILMNHKIWLKQLLCFFFYFAKYDYYPPVSLTFSILTAVFNVISTNFRFAEYLGHLKLSAAEMGLKRLNISNRYLETFRSWRSPIIITNLGVDSIGGRGWWYISGLSRREQPSFTTYRRPRGPKIRNYTDGSELSVIRRAPPGAESEDHITVQIQGLLGGGRR